MSHVETGRTWTSGNLGRGSADAGQIARDALVEAYDGGRELVDGCDEGQPYSGHDEGVLDEVLPLFVTDELDEKLHWFSPFVDAVATFAAGFELSKGPTHSFINPVFQRSHQF